MGIKHLYLPFGKNEGEQNVKMKTRKKREGRKKTVRTKRIADRKTGLREK